MKIVLSFMALVFLLLSPRAFAWWGSERWSCTFFFQMGGQRQAVTGEGSTMSEANQRAFDLCRRAGQYQACMDQFYLQNSCHKVE